MRRVVENVQRISYLITEEEVLDMIREHSHELAGVHTATPVFGDSTVIERQVGGGYRIVSEFVKRVDELT